MKLSLTGQNIQISLPLNPFCHPCLPTPVSVVPELEKRFTFVTDLEALAVALPTLAIAPAQVVKGHGIIAHLPGIIARFGSKPLVVGGQRAIETVQAALRPAQTEFAWVINHSGECSASALSHLQSAIADQQADVVIGVGGGKALDLAKLAAHQCQLPVLTIPTSAATCAAWTALSNLYSEQGSFDRDVALPQCPSLLLLDYDLIRLAPVRTLIAGVGDALAKWYEASVSSGHVDQTLTIAAVQQARVLRDILLQKTPKALATPGGADWQEIVDASVLMAGVIGGLGGAQCRTVAAHAVHNGLTHLSACHNSLHGEKVAYGILVQLRLEELIQGNQLAIAARQQLLDFYTQIGLPRNLEELGLGSTPLQNLQQAAGMACAPNSDIHRLPFTVSPEQLITAMVSTDDFAPKSSLPQADPSVSLPMPTRIREVAE